MKHAMGARVLGCTVGASIVLGGIGAVGPQLAVAMPQQDSGSNHVL